jgi:hypothetical protein
MMPTDTKSSTSVTPRRSIVATTLLRNDYANPVAASKLPFEKPVIGNSGSAFCSPFATINSGNVQWKVSRNRTMPHMLRDTRTMQEDGRNVKLAA